MLASLPHHGIVAFQLLFLTSDYENYWRYGCIITTSSAHEYVYNPMPSVDKRLRET
jgi:hypothetical protein